MRWSYARLLLPSYLHPKNCCLLFCIWWRESNFPWLKTRRCTGQCSALHHLGRPFSKFTARRHVVLSQFVVHREGIFGVNDPQVTFAIKWLKAQNILGTWPYIWTKIIVIHNSLADVEQPDCCICKLCRDITLSCASSIAARFLNP